MATHEGLPVKGYRAQDTEKVDIVNANKDTEERILRMIEDQRARGVLEPRFAALAITNLQQAFMWLNRAVFRPARVTLPED